MMNKMIIWTGIILIIGLVLWTIGSWIAIRSVEQLPYTLIEQKDGYEIREYPPHIIAQTTVPYDATSPDNQGFRIIAGYIFGGNSSKQSIAMTTPVITQSSEKIAMTTPVITSQDDTTMTMAFVMPQSYTLDTLPTPNDDRVELIEIPDSRAAVYSFSRYTDSAKIEKLIQALEDNLRRDNITTSGSIQLMRYNPPFTIPFLRRNELVINIEK